MGMRPARAALPAAALAVIAAALPASAGAAVQLGPERVVVSSSGGSATILRKPFRIEFADAHGRTLLSEATPDGAGVLPIAPVPDPVPLGTDTQKRPTLYAPLQFIVGSARDVQYPAEQWEGNELSGTEAGVMFSAVAVEQAEQAGPGVKLTVTTTDPSGRKLFVTVAPFRNGAFRVSARPDRPDGVATMGDSFSSPAGEAFRGFGGRHNSLDQAGQDFYNWIEQENLGAGYAQAAFPHGYLFPNGATGAYWVQSQFISSSGYGFLLDRDEISRWRMASDRPDAWQVSAAAPALDYVVVPAGDQAQAVSRLTAIGGRHQAPPEWGLGPMMDRATKFPNETQDNYTRAVQDDLKHIGAGDIPLTGYRIEGWPLLDPRVRDQVVGKLHSLGIHALRYFRAFTDANDNAGTDDPTNYKEAVDGGYVATTPTGQPYYFVDNFGGQGVLYDFTNPATVKWWKARIKQALDQGADGFMQDFGEQVQVDMRFHDGSTGAEMHNRYPVLYHRVTREAIDEWRQAHPGRAVFWYTRSGYSGTPGSPASEMSNFPGDETTDWSRSSGLASLATDMLNRAVGGAYGFNTDVGGYFDIGPYPETTKELFIRWAEWAALSPVMRLHGAVGSGTHAPWTFDRETVGLYKQISALHVKARGLIMRLWKTAERTGIPPTRPLWLAYPGDPQAAQQDQEWLLGRDVLVAPVVEEGRTSREVYFPRGCWRRGTRGTVFHGPASHQVDAPLATLPWFFRCGVRSFRQARPAA